MISTIKIKGTISWVIKRQNGWIRLGDWYIIRWNTPNLGITGIRFIKVLKSQEMIDTVMQWYLDCPLEIQEEFKNTKFEDLSIYHYTLGRDIRNKFSLWTHPWEPVLVDGIDYSPMHPDAISMGIIKTIWKKLQPKKDKHGKD